MNVINKTKGFVISENAEFRGSFWGRFRGLMLSPRKDIILASGREGITESSIHMMFMLYPIDVVWVDGRMRVVDVRKGVRPFSLISPSTWRTYRPKSPAKYVIEVASGGVGGTECGDEVAFG